MIIIILLAAGGSRRMPPETIKQLLPWGNSTLLGHAIRQAKAVPGTQLFVVLGAQANSLLPIIENEQVEYGIYDNWELGMGHSLAWGVTQVLEKKPAAVIVSLSDMPRITSDIYSKLVSTYNSENKHIIAGRFNYHITPPVLFDHEFLSDLVRLEGDQGAGGLVKKNQQHAKFIELGDVGVDIDTWEDYKRLHR